MKPEWVKTLMAIVGAIFLAGVAWAIVKGDIQNNARTIETIVEDIESLEESDKTMNTRMTDTEILLRGVQTDVEWIRGTLEREYGN